MMQYTIPLTKPHFSHDEINEVQKVLDSGWVSSGPECNVFEKMVCHILDVPYAVAVSSCTAAIRLSMNALGLGKNDEIIVADFSFPATGISVLPATPRFCDVSSTTYNIESDAFSPYVHKITGNTKAIVPVHTFGNPCYMDEITSIAKYYGLFVIEDAACAFGSKYKNKYVGTWGDIGCFSFHARKGITTGEGGMIVTHDKSIADNIRKTANFGVEPTWGRKNTPVFNNQNGFNFKMSDISAAIGVAQLRKLYDIIKRRREIAKMYCDLLKTVTPQVETFGGTHIYQSFVGITNERDRMIETLRRAGIEAGIGTYAQHTQPVFNSRDVCKSSEFLYRKTISLPIFYDISESEIHRVVDVVNTCH